MCLSRVGNQDGCLKGTVSTRYLLSYCFGHRIRTRVWRDAGWLSDEAFRDGVVVDLEGRCCVQCWRDTRGDYTIVEA